MCMGDRDPSMAGAGEFFFIGRGYDLDFLTRCDKDIANIERSVLFQKLWNCYKFPLLPFSTILFSNLNILR